MKIEDLIDELKGMLEYVDHKQQATLKSAIQLIDNLYKRQKATPAIFKHEVGDEVALAICPECKRSIIISLEKQLEFTDSWYCEDCGQHLTLENDED